jgi:hypothetical protein
LWREFDSQRTALQERYSQGSLGGGTGAQPVSGITGRPVLFSAQTAPSVEVRGEGG